MAVTAALVKELRDKTGAGMMDCKGALVETDGDIEAAVDWLRAKGLSKAAKKAGRAAAEGLIGVASDGPKAVMVEVNSETDFVARNEKFQDMVLQIAGVALEAGGDVDTVAGDRDRAGVTRRRPVDPRGTAVGLERARRALDAAALDDRRVADELEEPVHDLGEHGLLGQKLLGQAVDRAGVLGHVALGIEVAVKMIAGRDVVQQLDAADLDHPMTVVRVQTRGLGIEHDLTHRGSGNWRGGVGGGFAEV